jgi:hypothetical protein
MPPHRKLGEILVDLGVLKPREVNQILQAAHRRQPPEKFGKVARAMNLLGEEAILAGLAVQMNLFPDLTNPDLPAILARLQESTDPPR